MVVQTTMSEEYNFSYEIPMSRFRFSDKENMSNDRI